MYLLDDRAWKLPNWLDKVLPNLDIEGEHLQQTVEHHEPARV